MYLYAVFVGVFCGVVAASFTVFLRALDVFAITGAASPPTYDTFLELLAARWWILFLPAAGALASGLLTYHFAPEASGTGTDAMINAFHNKEGRVRSRTSYIKGLATIVTVATGGSAGQEGPLAQIGSGFGARWADSVGAGSRARRTLLLAGAAGGLGAIFQTPLGGALTAIEVLYREDFESDAFVPSVIASVTGYALTGALWGSEHVFSFQAQVTHSGPVELVLYLSLGLLCIPVGWAYVRLFSFGQAQFARLPFPRWCTPAVGGLIVGAIGIFYPEVLGTGTAYLQSLMSGTGETSLQVFAVLVILKIVTTTCTVGAGASGGVFMPSLFIGGILGASVGTVGMALFPEQVTAVGPFVLVGMGAFFAGVANAPLAGLLMVCEMSGGYALLAPMLGVGVLALIFTRRWSIYRHQVLNRFHSPAHLFDMRPDVLSANTVLDAIEDWSRRTVVKNDMQLFALEIWAHELHETDFIVVDQAGHYAGAVSLRHTMLREPDPFLRQVVLLEDVADKVAIVTPQDSLRHALAALVSADMDKVAVVDDTGKVLGGLSMRAILRAYEGAVRRLAPAAV